MHTKIINALKKAGAEVLGTTQDGQFDAVKIQVLVNSTEFEISVEAADHLIIMYPNYTWTYKHKSVDEIYAIMQTWEK